MPHLYHGVALGLIALSLAGCTDEIIIDSLAAGNPALASAPVGVPPVPPEALRIMATGMPPTHTARIAPDPILPHMDEAYRTRWMPPEAEVTQPAERPSQQETPPEDQFQPEKQDETPPHR